MSDDFRKDNEMRMAVYNENTGKIADYLFSKFYKLEQFDLYYDPEVENLDRERCRDKAERLYHFFDNVNDIKRMVEFINTVNPALAKDLVDGL